VLQGVLLGAGLSERASIDAALVLTTYVVGFALERQAAAPPSAGASHVDDAFRKVYPHPGSIRRPGCPGSTSGQFGVGPKSGSGWNRNSRWRCRCAQATSLSELTYFLVRMAGSRPGRSRIRRLRKGLKPDDEQGRTVRHPF
jgi:hypothetical protein